MNTSLRWDLDWREAELVADCDVGVGRQKDRPRLHLQVFDVYQCLESIFETVFVVGRGWIGPLVEARTAGTAGHAGELPSGSDLEHPDLVLHAALAYVADTLKLRFGIRTDGQLADFHGRSALHPVVQFVRIRGYRRVWNDAEHGLCSALDSLVESGSARHHDDLAHRRELADFEGGVRVDEYACGLGDSPRGLALPRVTYGRLSVAVDL